MSEPPADPESSRGIPGDESPADVPAEGEFERKPFLEHLHDLRTTLLKGALVFGVALVVSFALLKPIFGLLRIPLRGLGQHGVDPGSVGLIALGPQEGFAALMRVAFMGAFVLSMPFWLVFAGQFVVPALTPRERRALLPALLIAALLFLTGVVFAFTLTLPLALGLLWRLFEAMGMTSQWTARYYVSFATGFMLANGLVFELPLVLVVLVRIGLVTIEQLRRRRRHAIMVILLISACLTPPDASSMFMVAVPMYVLYEASIIAASILERRRSTR